MLKMVMVVYNEALDSEVMALLGGLGLNYTKVSEVFGKGKSSGVHGGNDIWPGRNNMGMIVCQEAQVKDLISGVKTIRSQFSNEGIKAFILPVEEST